MTSTNQTLTNSEANQNSHVVALSEPSTLKELTRLKESVTSLYTSFRELSVVAVVYDSLLQTYAVYLVYQDKLIKFVGFETQFSQLTSLVSTKLTSGATNLIKRTTIFREWLQTSYVKELVENACLLVNLTVDQSIYLGNLTNNYILAPSRNFATRVNTKAVEFYVLTRDFAFEGVNSLSTSLAERLNSLIERLGLDKEEGLIKITTNDQQYIEISIKKSLFVINSNTFEAIRKVIDEVVEETKKRASATLEASVKRLEWIRTFVTGLQKQFLKVEEEKQALTVEVLN